MDRQSYGRRVLASVVLSSCAAFAGCLSFPDPEDATERYACSSNAGCISGYECVAGYCAKADEKNEFPHTCGDGTTDHGEACDDGANGDNCDGCLDDCSAHTNTCGDGYLCGTETCDDGPLNGQPNQCNAACSGTTASNCGNSTPEAGEDCDDGANGDNCDGCLDDCSAHTNTCGDGYLCGTETCDDGPLNGQPGGCNLSCTGTTSATCGNSTPEAGEDCDDGANGDNCDGCLDDCTTHASICGDGYVCGTEACDDGYADACGTCNATCSGPGFGPPACNAATQCPELGSAVCATGHFCSGVGECIEDDTCRVDDDCPGELVYCSHAHVCLPPDGCAEDDDCAITLADRYGQGYACEQGSCIERLTCTANDEECLPTKFCSVAGNCLARPYCDDDDDCPAGETTQLCSQAATRQCIDAGTCLVDEDCDTANGETCGANLQCLTSGACATNADCPPAYACNLTTFTCDVSGTSCTTNETTFVGCLPGELYCCPAGETCCTGQNQRCSATDPQVCIPDGSCVDDSDCLTSYFSCDDYLCVPTKPCTSCDAGETCTGLMVGGTFMTGCIPAGSCAEDDDCPAGEACGDDWRCYPDENNCGAQTVSTGSVVAPNVLIVLDRSGSMNICGRGDTSTGPCGYNAGDCDSSSAEPQCLPDDDDIVCAPLWGNKCMDADCATGDPADPVNPSSTVTRWEDTYAAVSQITDDYSGQVRFGLAIYPLPSYLDSASTADDGCWQVKDTPASGSIKCNWDHCANSMNAQAGSVAVAVGNSTRTAILGALDQTAPGGGTPTGPTLRGILGQDGRAGLADAERPNAILLVTDGEATGDSNLQDPLPAISCEPPCGDAVKNGSETDADCGGLCPPCATGKACATDDDCDSRICRVGLCRGDTCSNDSLDASEGETDIDCGGPCAPCDDGKLCAADTDCASQVCTDDHCVAPACGDGKANGTETDADCGGICTTKCAVHKGCAESADCETGVCQEGTCRLAECGNDSLDATNSETDVDCGGDHCAPCAEGETCQTGTDCSTGYCASNACGHAFPHCHNGVLDTDDGETDVDCGGASCPACPGGRVCTADTDCLSGTCRSCTWDGMTLEGYFDQQACWADSAIDRLFAQMPRIRTFVVGFAFGGVNAYLNCHAARGRTLRPDVSECAQATTQSCDQVSEACYYRAENRAELSSAFSTIIDRVASCDYVIARPPEPNRVFVYLENRSVDPPVRERLQRGVSWEYIAATDQLQLYKSACDRVKTPDTTPLVIYGCIEGGG